MKFWNETAAGNPVSVSVKIIITFLLFVQDWESFGWSSPAAAEHQNRSHPTSSSEAVREAVRKWAELQAGQRILVTTPSVVVGYRCQVYRSEGATQWYTAVIVGLDEETGVCHQFTRDPFEIVILLV